MNHTTKRILIKSLKAAIGCCLAVLIAMVLGLAYATSAGIITLLSLQDTTKETLKTALQRFLSFLAALIIALVSFHLLGYTLLGLGMYLLFYVMFCYMFSFQNSISICSVLIAHFWVEQTMALGFIYNELLLLLIGVGIGVGLNLFLPRNVMGIKADQQQIDGIIRRVLKEMAAIIHGNRSGEIAALLTLEKVIKSAKKRANEAMNNALTIDLKYYVEYLDMRKNQLMVLKRIEGLLPRLNYAPRQAHEVAGLIEKIAGSFNEYNNAVALLQATAEIRGIFKEEPLPESRNEFEVRAILFQILNDMEYFLLIKNTFAQALTEEQKALFWNETAAGI